MKNTDSILSTTVGEEGRRTLERDEALGAGNFLDFAISVSPAPDAPILWLERTCRMFSGDVHESFSLSSLKAAASAYAAWYSSEGVRPKDPVGVYLDDGVEYLLHYIALTSLGAIPVMTNGNMPPEIAAAYFRRVGAVGLFVDPPHREALAPYLRDDDTYLFVLTDGDWDPALVLAPLPASHSFNHAPIDPIMIAHSSGTTGVPKAVVLQHAPFFHGIRFRLRVSSTGGAERIMSALPHSHNCAMAYIMLALLSGDHVFISSDHSGVNLGRRIASFRPTMVVSFPQTYVELTETALSESDFSSVRFWFNGGDAAHEQHIRSLIALGHHAGPSGPLPGSTFVDGMGSSEMGFSLFRNVHALDQASTYDRCVGVPVEWASATVLGDNGEELSPGCVGRLGVKAPSVTSGYWNDSLLTFRALVDGFWLTGDLAYRDEKGRYFHVDRVPDVIRTAAGPVYGLATEELLLKSLGAIADCTVFGVPRGDGYDAPVALVRARTAAWRDDAALLNAVNAVLDAKGWERMAAARLVGPEEIPLGTTGKVLKRVLRDRHAGLLVDAARSMGPSRARRLDGPPAGAELGGAE